MRLCITFLNRRIGRLVTMQDVENVIEGLCYYQNDDVSGEIGSIDSTVQSAPLSRQSCRRDSSSSWSREHDLQMDRLLATISPDVARLAGERLHLNRSSHSAYVDEASSFQSYQQRVQEHFKRFAAEGEGRGRQEEGTRRGNNSSLSDKSDLIGDTGIDTITPNTDTTITITQVNKRLTIISCWCSSSCPFWRIIL